MNQTTAIITVFYLKTAEVGLCMEATAFHSSPKRPVTQGVLSRPYCEASYLDVTALYDMSQEEHIYLLRH